MRRLTISIDEELYAHIHKRAEFNRRSMGRELCFLAEAALASELNTSLEILRALLKAQGGLTPEQTATDALQPVT